MNLLNYCDIVILSNTIRQLTEINSKSATL
uniref:Uncharacterized protein n=1 Tax=Myoviridae sp. ctDzM5 TaxID=2825058 RepID=A0A8S5V8C6_9CAUD|nr:MAG TPA: hypothetical protein [Myoviridae sp. ctDzM5]